MYLQEPGTPTDWQAVAQINFAVLLVLCQTTTLAEPEPLERSAHRERAVKETETELAGERGRFPVSRALLYRPRQAYRPSQGVAILVALGSGPWAWLGTTSRA